MTVLLDPLTGQGCNIIHSQARIATSSTHRPGLQRQPLTRQGCNVMFVNPHYDMPRRVVHESSVSLRTILIIILLTSFVRVTRGACDFTCPHGHVKRPSGYPSEVNGCGGQGSIDLNPVFPAFTEICNDHDRCYGVCGALKAVCDNEFWQGMRRYCESWRKHSVDFSRDCNTIASIYTAGVQAFGCQFYIDGQRRGCTCVRSRST